MLLIFGANGQLGQNFAHFWPLNDITLIDRDICDITNINDVKKVLNHYRPDVVLNAAAYTNVNEAETDKGQINAFQINGEAVKIIAIETAKINIPLIHISTDYIFDGQKTSPYQIDDAPNPTNIYGRSKLKGEDYFHEFAKCGAIIRISHLSSDFGNNIVKTFIKLLSTRDSLNIVSDQKICMTYGHDVVNFVKKLCDKKSLYNDKHIYHLGSCDALTFLDLATILQNHLDTNCEIKPVTLAEFSTGLQKPLYSVLNVSSAQEIYDCLPWEKGLEALECVKS